MKLLGRFEIHESEDLAQNGQFHNFNQHFIQLSWLKIDFLHRLNKKKISIFLESSINCFGRF